MLEKPVDITKKYTTAFGDIVHIHEVGTEGTYPVVATVTMRELNISTQINYTLNGCKYLGEDSPAFDLVLVE